MMTAVLHECDYKDEMLADIKSILKPGGLLFIEEPHTKHPMPKAKGCHLPYFTEEEFKATLARNGIGILEEKPIPDAGTGERFRKSYKCKVL